MSIYKSSKESAVVDRRSKKPNLMEIAMRLMWEDYKEKEEYVKVDDYTRGSGNPDPKSEEECRDADADFVVKVQKKIEMQTEGINRKDFLDADLDFLIHAKMLGSDIQRFHPNPKRYYKEFGLNYKESQNYLPLDLADAKDLRNKGGVIPIWVLKENGYSVIHSMDWDWVKNNHLKKSVKDYESDAAAGLKRKIMVKINPKTTFYSLNELYVYYQEIINEKSKDILNDLFLLSGYNFKYNQDVLVEMGNSVKHKEVKSDSSKWPIINGEPNPLNETTYVNMDYKLPNFKIHQIENLEERAREEQKRLNKMYKKQFA